MERLTTDTPNGNFETMLNFVYGKDGWAYIRHDGAHEDIMLTDWAKQQCLLRGCNEVEEDGPEDIDQRLCDCMMEGPTCPIAMAYCFASQAMHLWSRLKTYENAMPLDHARELAQTEKDGRLMVLPSNDPLTLEELREMHGEPVWGEKMKKWFIIVVALDRIAFVDMYGECYSQKMIAPIYRYKPEEEK